jgi:trimethylamine---corrinoid protein Co-methyltransferase
MGSKRVLPIYKILPEQAISKISNASFDILENVGVRIPNKKVWNKLREFGAVVNEDNSVVRIFPEIISKAIESAGKKHILYGRKKENTAEFGYDMFNFNSSSGQYMIVDHNEKKRLNPKMADLRKAIKIGDYLKNIDVVGAMVVPSDINPKLQDVYTFLELISGTVKPFTGWIFSGRTAKTIIKMLEIVCGSKENLRNYPPYEAFIEPVSPLSFRSESIDILMEFAEAGLPVSFGPMVQAGSTGPINLAGTIAQENAEILSGIVISQAIKPGLPVTYGGIPHVMDMRTMMISFGSPEQGLMAAAITQLARSYKMPVYNNTGMTDSKIPDAQSGVERAASLMMGILSGGDIFGHLGISGADNGADLVQLIIDNEMASYIKRVMKSFEVNDETIALDDIKDVGIGGNYFRVEKTLRDFKKEIWYPEIFDRYVWDKWEENGKKSTIDVALGIEGEILRNHEQCFLEEELRRECENIVISLEKELHLK